MRRRIVFALSSLVVIWACKRNATLIDSTVNVKLEDLRIETADPKYVRFLPAAGQPKSAYQQSYEQAMVQYSQKHYCPNNQPCADAKYQLDDIKGIVLHYTATFTFPFNLVGQDEKISAGNPPVSCHYIIYNTGKKTNNSNISFIESLDVGLEKVGATGQVKIYQTLPLDVRGRCAYGGNHRSISIEVHSSDEASLLADAESMKAAALLTAALLKEYDLTIDDVYSHQEVDEKLRPANAQDTSKLPLWSINYNKSQGAYGKTDPGETAMAVMKGVTELIMKKDQTDNQGVSSSENQEAATQSSESISLGPTRFFVQVQAGFDFSTGQSQRTVIKERLAQSKLSSGQQNPAAGQLCFMGSGNSNRRIDLTSAIRVEQANHSEIKFDPAANQLVQVVNNTLTSQPCTLKRGWIFDAHWQRNQAQTQTTQTQAVSGDELRAPANSIAIDRSGQVGDLPRTADELAQFYLANPTMIKRETKKLWNKSYSCAATLTTLLRLADLPVGALALLTNQVEASLQYCGWQKKTDFFTVTPGDICFNDHQVSNVACSWSHVYMFLKWQDKLNLKASILDNNGIPRHGFYISKNSRYSKTSLCYSPPASGVNTCARRMDLVSPGPLGQPVKAGSSQVCTEARLKELTRGYPKTNLR